MIFVNLLTRHHASGFTHTMKVTSTFSFLVLLGMSSLLLAGPEPIPVSSKEVRQELPPNPFTWEGSYIGLHGGGTFGETEANDTREYTNFTFVDDEHAESWSYDTAGFMGGIQWGYLWQRGHFVFGPETDLGYLNVNGGGTLHGDQVDAHSSTESNFY